MSEEKPHYIGHRKRVREKFLESSGKGFQDYEILEIMLFGSSARGDVKPLAKDLIKYFGSLSKVIAATPEELKKVKGMGEAAIACIKVAENLSQRIIKEEITEGKTVIQSWKALLDYCRTTMRHVKIEQFRVFFLNQKNQLIADELQQQGTVDHTSVYPREVVKRALELGASSIILAHNHPSGDPTPSRADIDITRQIVQAAAHLGLNVHDHLIIAGNKHYSFKTHGLI